MTPQPSTPLRVRFAKAMGWNTQKETLGSVCIYRDPKGNIAAVLPDPTDSNTVREAWMGMTEKERVTFCKAVIERMRITAPNIKSHFAWAVIEAFILLPPPTLAELICEVRGF